MIVETEDEIQVKALPGQLEILACEDRLAFYTGGFGCGKTEGLAMFLDQECHLYKDNYVCAAAQTYTQLGRSTIRKMKEYLGSRSIPFKYNKNEKSIQYLDGCGSEIVFQTCDIAPEMIQGPEYGALAIDESESVSYEHFRKLRGRVRKKLTSRRTRVFGNPPPEKHWITDIFRKGDVFFYCADTRENIALPQDYIDDLLELYPPGTPGYRRYITGEVGVPMEGAVYQEFSSRIHLIDADDVPWKRMVGWVNGLDFGYHNPFAFLVAAVDDDDCMYVADEHFAAGLLLPEHAEHIRAIYQGGPILRDHDSQAAAELEEMGIITIPARKEVALGIDAVRKRLVKRKLKIIRGAAPNLVREFGVYLWHPTKEIPLKVDDHAMDALRYLTVGLDCADTDVNLREAVYGA